MEQVADGMNPLASQRFGNARTDALHILHGRGEFKHS